MASSCPVAADQGVVGLARVAATHSSIISEVLSMAVVVAAAAVLAAQLWRGGRTEHAHVVLLLTAAAAGVPVLGVRASLGPDVPAGHAGGLPCRPAQGSRPHRALGPGAIGARSRGRARGRRDAVAAVVRLGAFAVAANGWASSSRALCVTSWRSASVGPSDRRKHT